MSLKTISQYFVIIFISGAIGYSGNYFYAQHIKQDQSINLSSTQKPFLQGKNQDAVLVKIENPKLPQLDSEIVEIVGYLQAQIQSESPVKYQWILPNDVQLIEGSLTGEFTNESARNIQTFRIKISGFSIEQRKIISLQVDTEMKYQAIGNSYSISSQPHETWEYYAQEMKKNKDDFVAATEQDNSNAKEIKIIK